MVRLVIPDDAVPLACPHCGGEIRTYVARWYAESLEEDNRTELDEHQCAACGHSFWT